MSYALAPVQVGWIACNTLDMCDVYRIKIAICGSPKRNIQVLRNTSNFYGFSIVEAEKQTILLPRYEH